MAAASPAASNRFAPLASPRSPPEASRSTSPTHPDASQPPRSASPPPPKLRHSIISRFRTYPPTWTYTQLPPRQLATCGFSCDPLKEGECFCPVCEERIDIPELISEGILTNNGLLGAHTGLCPCRYDIRHVQEREGHLHRNRPISPSIPKSPITNIVNTTTC